MISTHIQNNEHPSAIRLLKPLLLQESNLQIQKQARRLFEDLISKVKEININERELVCIKYECLTVISETFSKMEDFDQSKEINKLIKKLKSSIPQYFLDALEEDVLYFSLQLRWAGKDFGRETYKILINAAWKISNPEEKTKALIKLMQILRSAKLENQEWIEEVEDLLGMCDLFGNSVPPGKKTVVSMRSRKSLLLGGLTVAATQIRDHANQRRIKRQQMSPNQILARIIETEDGKKREALFRAFYYHMIYEDHFEEDLCLISTLDDSIVRDEILDRLVTLLEKDKKAVDLILDQQLFLRCILSYVDNPEILGRFFAI